MKKISVEELKKKMDAGGEVQLVDVRSSQEYLSARIVQAQFAPITHFDHYAPLLDKEREVYALCGGGGRAGEFCRMLERLGGYTPVVVDGGIRAWIERGYPVEIGPKQMWSLERQTRFGAGMLALLGVLLGAFVHPGFLLLAGFIRRARGVGGGRRQKRRPEPAHDLQPEASGPGVHHLPRQS